MDILSYIPSACDQSQPIGQRKRGVTDRDSADQVVRSVAQATQSSHTAEPSL